MKKILFFAATAMLFAACANEEALAPQTAEVAANAISFDTYTASATRAGSPEGVMTTDKLKYADKGFGVFAFHHDNTTYPANNTVLTPNFMYNEHVSWNNGAWTYSPLKYWPNETGQDSQTEYGAATSESRVDRLTFFAYAPYVSTGEGNTLPNKDGKYYVNTASPETSGVISISAETYDGDPKVKWGFSTDLDNNVDLLWGVAPMGMAYQSVNPTNPKTADPGYVNKTFGLPLLDMLKPDKDLKMKFLFDHALSRIGLSVVSAVDQIAAGDDGSVFKKEDTRVLIEEVKIWGDFTTQGTLNLNNTTENVAKWENVTKSTSNAGTPLLTFDNGIPASANGYIAEGLRYLPAQIAAVTGTPVGTGANEAKFTELKEGVLPSEKVLLEPGLEPNTAVTNPTYAFGTKYYTYDPTFKIAKATTTPATAKVYSKDGSDNYTQVYDGTGTGYEVDGTTQYYTLTGTDVALTGTISSSTVYYTTADAGVTWTKQTAGSDFAATGAEYSLSETPVTATYAAGEYYTATTKPRYFMVIPSDLTPTPTTINVRIKYHVVTKDTKLTGYISDVTNEITKQTQIQLESGKAYNLKLILGLTSVKLDATVADWQVDGSTEVWLPRNNE